MTVFLLLIQLGLASGQAKPFRLFLIGDAGENAETGQTLKSLQQLLQNDSNSAVIFLGDNSYRNLLLGLVHKGVKGFDGGSLTRKKVISQLSILTNYKGSAFFIPGNHDWWNRINIKRGKKSLLREELFVEDFIKQHTTVINRNEETFLPANGYPGPVSKLLNNKKLRIVFLDTQRLILAEMRSTSEEKELLQQFYFRLDSVLSVASTNNEKIVLVAHHPIVAEGEHSQNKQVKEFKTAKHFNPVNNIKYRIQSSNLSFLTYHTVAAKIDSLLKKHNQSEITYATGHEHSLEFFFRNNIQYIVSGAGSKTDSLNKADNTTENNFCLWNQQGFFEMDFYPDSEKIKVLHRKKNETELIEECLKGCN